MSKSDVEIIRAAVDAGNRGDWETAFKDAGPGFVWDNSRAIGSDNRGMFSRDEVRDYLAQFGGLWEYYRVEIDEFIPLGDHYVVPHTLHVRGRDGLEARAQTTWLVTIREGQLDRISLYQSREEALEDAGLTK